MAEGKRLRFSVQTLVTSIKSANIKNQQLKFTAKNYLLLSSLAILSAAIAPLAAKAADIVLGTSAAFDGPSRALGIELYRGSQAYINYINDRGGVNGQRISIRAYNDSYNPIPAINNTIKLIEEDDVFVLFNYVGTPTVTRILPLLSRYSDRHFYLFFPFTGAQPQRQPPYEKFTFNLRASYQQETAGLVENFLKIGRRRIAVFYQADAYGRSGWDGVRRELAKSNLKMVGEATYRRGTLYSASFKEQIEILQASNPDAIISIGAYAACAALIRDARDAGWNIPIANISFVGSESLLKLLQETGSKTGKDYTKNLINSQVVPSYEDTSLPAVREYRQLMQQYNSAPPPDWQPQDYEALPYSFVSFEGFLNAKLLVEILKRLPQSPSYSLPTGAKEQELKQLPESLQERGFFSGKIDGIFGDRAQTAARSFQTSAGLQADGKVNSKPGNALVGKSQQRSAILPAVEGMQNIDLGINAPVSFSAQKHQGLDKVYYTIIEKGRFVPLKNWQVLAK